jgi:hypothetical protein
MIAAAVVDASNGEIGTRGVALESGVDVAEMVRPRLITPVKPPGFSNATITNTISTTTAPMPMSAV